MRKIINYIGLLGIIFFANYYQASSQTYVQKLENFRAAYKAAFLEDRHAPLDSGDLKDLRFFPIDSAYRVTAQVELIHDPVPIYIPTFSGIDKKYIRYAKLNFKLFTKNFSLTLFKSIDLLRDPTYAEYLFLPFTDLTNDKESYGGGRYIDMKLQDFKGNTVILDFNKAYNPYCAYSDGYNCPIPPQENALAIAIKAGEKKYRGKHKQRKIR